VELRLHERTDDDGRSVRILNLIGEYTRECLLIRAERCCSSAKVIGAVADVMVMKGVPEHIRSDNGPEFVAKDLRKWLADTGASWNPNELSGAIGLQYLFLIRSQSHRRSTVSHRRLT
jgi:hypothetical protein